ncbi:kinase-like domain-containing protein [Lentinula detonsa]|uniref:non-specific serine/threonine protein kinase n=1 Tax=Lentinula detonsa TaxID=2804962 RepID=A0AA38Q573_9AGAR|nr:kinase-like domain-containing protein [Lentinula detonsa]
MTNMPAGSKRTLDSGSSNESRDRKRARDDPKDWRDVHLKSTSYKPSSSSRRESYDRDRDRKSYHGAERRRRSRSRDHGKSRRDRDVSREKRTEPKRPEPSPPRYTLKYDDEKEEGEISPRHSPVMQISVLSPPSSPKPPPEPELLPEMELDIPPTPPPVEETIASRRAKRQAILAKYANASASVSPSPVTTTGLSSAVPALQTPSAVSDLTSHDSSLPQDEVPNGISGKQGSLSPSPSVGQDFALAKEGDEKSSELKKQEENVSLIAGEQISAADYDPSLDRREDEGKRIQPSAKAEEEEEVEEIEEEEEDDVEDMFAVASTDKPKKVKKVKKVVKIAPALIASTLDSAADSEGYYTVILGEQLDGGRYQVFSSLGKGMFANVVRARVLIPEGNEPSGREVAIKIVRCQESMYKAGLKEVQMLNKLKQADPEDKKHIVRIERTFEHRGHLCIVFESLSMNLRDVVKRFGKDVGLNIRAVRAYAHQLFLALNLLKKVGVMHADIKPDNILVNEHKSLLKLCDLGSASDASENDITPYLVSRFYRAPEIIMGVTYDPSIDIWSIGCTLYELYTGKILFPGRSNNQMLLLMMELKGKFNSKMIKKAKFGGDYFDDMGGFNSVEKDRVLGTDVMKTVHISKPARDLRSRLMPPTSVKMKDDESKMLTSFIDLLDKCLALDPARRITPREALVHPFIRG